MQSQARKKPRRKRSTKPKDEYRIRILADDGSPHPDFLAYLRRFLNGVDCAHPHMAECCPGCGHYHCPDCGLEWDDDDFPQSEPAGPTAADFE